MKVLRLISNAIEKIETLMIFLMVISMVIISFLQVILRNLFHSGIAWGDEITRHQVLWIGLIAMAVATAHAKHINIDIISRFLREKQKRVLNFIKYLFSAGICFVLVMASIKFIRSEKEFGEVSLNLRVPIWYLEILFPICFSLSGIRFILIAIEDLLGIKREEEEEKPI